ncbi:hypothetical protein PIB30_031713 [Stylosanthes scabra]|uniref:Uncharacterized protein n=1 Tax=Stylosanthes scabra TaxID=79078 RepID=A0ABU6SC62_9FABA|nr:hypothetical protein [Stylosanthes scabra]
MGSDVIYYEYEKRENVRFDHDRPYEIPIEALMTDKVLSSSKDEKSSTQNSSSSRHPTPRYSPRGMPSSQRVSLTSSAKGTSSFRYRMASSSLSKPESWELIPPSEGWMCNGDNEKEIGGMKPTVKKEVSSEEDPEEEEDPKEEDPEDEGKESEEEDEDSEKGIPASPSLPMDIDADEDYLYYIEELERLREPSPPRSSQSSLLDTPAEASDRQSDGHNASSYDLSRVWPTPSCGPSV